ncbi:hypothetical protein BDP81DRAFT_34531 [Colletotrichum phormii]|uniref:Uncharacterized protein n=1 Tax=Colletotrichum phormii TaxID=359342 RepID=A0AAI9ZSS2_9PEZI|nr:uncharacterized protein BDP81DRAFT_34531 [Colletotrichum phormii]KAK1636179.1 hypothetical protein BDP81DRAFT_34531 [Colletotrichum phormii]
MKPTPASHGQALASILAPGAPKSQSDGAWLGIDIGRLVPFSINLCGYRNSRLDCFCGLVVLRPIFPLLLALLTQTLCVCACLFLVGKIRKIRHSLSDRDSLLSRSLVLTPPLRPVSGRISRLFLVPAHPLGHSYYSRGSWPSYLIELWTCSAGRHLSARNSFLS